MCMHHICYRSLPIQHRSTKIYKWLGLTGSNLYTVLTCVDEIPSQVENLLSGNEINKNKLEI